ncbi:hypothetical protein acdb102_08440 [Acidothermaceae bacterium B102]|nr:hypothetical protein acdb102_08440 [Acidothermaceae bacterium B102]
MATLLLIVVGRCFDPGPFGDQNGFINLLATVGFLGMVTGGVSGVVVANRLLNRSEPEASTAATVIYLSTVLAVPVLLYLTAAVVFMVMFESYQF